MIVLRDHVVLLSVGASQYFIPLREWDMEKGAGLMDCGCEDGLRHGHWMLVDLIAMKLHYNSS